MRLPEPCYSVGLITTYQCNLNCKYCYITRKQNLRMPLETAKSILRPILEKEGDTLLVSLMGAETLMAADMICGLVEWTESEKWRRKCRFFGSTNGTLLTPELKTWFFEHRETITLGLSYDGLHGTQKKNRGTKKGQVPLEFFLKTWPEQKIQMTVDAESVSTMAEGVISLLERGFSVNANVAYEAEEWPEKSLREYERQLRVLADYYLAHPNAKRIYQFIHSINEYAENLQNPPVQKQMCGAGDGFWVFDTDGRFYPCHMLSPLVLNTERLRGLKETRIGCGQTDFADIRCRGCPFVTDCPTCIGCNFIYRDSFRRRDFTHCWIMEAEVRATMRMEILRLKKTKQLTSEDERLIRSINTVNAFLNG